MSDYAHVCIVICAEFLLATGCAYVAIDACISGLDSQSLKRLKLTPEKLSVLSSGIAAIAASEYCLGRILARTELAEGLVLDRISCSIG